MMAVTKRILVLANSIRHAPCTCIAGREAILEGAKYHFGPWVRPVSSHGEGELAPSETLLSNGKQPKVLDFVELSLAAPAKEPDQPENWTIEAGTRWRSVSPRYKRPPMDKLLEFPPNLWRQLGERSDRVAANYLKQNPPVQSLYFIRLDRLHVRFEWKPWEEVARRRRRAIFTYNGDDYDLGITDPAFHDRHRAKFPARGQPAAEIELDAKDGFYACVSLAHEFNGYHYKVVATILET
jgi:hypothetical protein